MEERHEQVTTTTTTNAATPAVPPATPYPTYPTATTTEQTEAVTVDPYAARRSALYRASQVIYLVFGIVEGLIAIRFILRLLGANPGAGFAQFIYGLTAPLIAPFVGLFPSPRFEGSVFEVTSLVAIIVYALVAWLLVKILVLLFSETRTGVVTRTTDTRIR